MRAGHPHWMVNHSCCEIARRAFYACSAMPNDFHQAGSVSLVGSSISREADINFVSDIQKV